MNFGAVLVVCERIEFCPPTLLFFKPLKSWYLYYFPHIFIEKVLHVIGLLRQLRDSGKSLTLMDFWWITASESSSANRLSVPINALYKSIRSRFQKALIFQAVLKMNPSIPISGVEKTSWPIPTFQGNTLACKKTRCVKPERKKKWSSFTGWVTSREFSDRFLCFINVTNWRKSCTLKRKVRSYALKFGFPHHPNEFGSANWIFGLSNRTFTEKKKVRWIRTS